MIKRSTLKQRR